MFFQIPGSNIFTEQLGGTSNNSAKPSNNSANTRDEHINRIRTVRLGIEGNIMNSHNCHIWIALLLINIFVIWSYIISPIRYSGIKVLDTITINRLYYYIHIILLIAIFLYSYSVSSRFPLYDNTHLYTTVTFGMILILSIFIINVFDSNIIEEDGTYKTPPNTMTKNKPWMITLNTVIIILLLCIIAIEFFKNPTNILGIFPPQNITDILGLSIIIVTIIGVYLLSHSIKYNVKKYKLPNMWLI